MDINNIKDPEFLKWLREKLKNSPQPIVNLEELYKEYISSQIDPQDINTGNLPDKSFTRTLTNGNMPVSPPVGNFNTFDSNRKNAAFTNWYGIILTLIFSFAIGYLIAWILIRVH